MTRVLPQDESFRPEVVDLGSRADSVDTFLRLATLPHVLFLDSALREPALGRYSFVAADPFDWVEAPADGSDGLDRLADRMSGWSVSTQAGLPPFQGGAAGLLGYDLNRSLERVPPPRFDEFEVPALAFGLYDVVVAFDHVEGRAWIVSQGLPETDPSRRRVRARKRAQRFRVLLDGAAPGGRTNSRAEREAVEEPPVGVGELAPCHATQGPSGLTSNFSADGYRRAIARAVERIHSGEMFQVNLAQRLLFPATDDPVALYLRLRERNAAPFSGYFDLGTFRIVSASPERFLSVRGRTVETRPIKGTRERTGDAEADETAGRSLLRSAKDRSENVMIVDLLRNDLSRVCLDDSIRVPQLCELERYAYVQHLVSVVRGELAPERTPLDLIRAAFPGGSITGAPKVRAMEVIAETEPTARGAYCGSLGYVGFDGTTDSSILIRTIVDGRGWWQMPVGGGIVADSDPHAEFDETWHKAEGLLRALK